MLWLVLSSIGLWVVVLFGVILMVTLLRLVGQLTLLVNEDEGREVAVGQEAPSWDGMEFLDLDGSSRPVERRRLAGMTVLFVTAGCESCDQAIEWTRSDRRTWLYMIAADSREASVAVQVWNIALADVCFEASGSSFREDFQIPAMPFAMVVDDDMVISRAGPINSAEDVRLMDWHEHEVPLVPGDLVPILPEQEA